MIDTYDLNNLQVCKDCNKVYMPRFERSEWLNCAPLEAVNTEYCESCRPLKEKDRG